MIRKEKIMDKQEVRKEVRNIASRFNKLNPIYIKSLDENSIEVKMKEGLNRIGDDNEQAETIKTEDDGS